MRWFQGHRSIPGMHASFKEEKSMLRWRAPALCLRISVAAMCAGFAWGSLGYGDVAFSFFFLTLDWSEDAALAVSHGAAYVFVAAAGLALWGRCWPIQLAVSGWLAAIAVMAMLDRPERAIVIPGARAIRVAAPLGLAWWSCRPRSHGVKPLLRCACAATFAAHGVEALWHEPAFLDFLFMASARSGFSLSQPVAEVILTAIGVVDLVAAVGVIALGGRTRSVVVAYMFLWGALTAAARVVHSGAGGLHEMLLRVPHAGVPLALFLSWRVSAENTQ